MAVTPRFPAALYGKTQLSEETAWMKPRAIHVCAVGRRKTRALLTAAILVLWKTISAINRTIFSGFKGNFTLFFAVRTDSFVHLSRTSVISSVLKSHSISPFWGCLFQAPIVGSVTSSINIAVWLLPFFPPMIGRLFVGG